MFSNRIVSFGAVALACVLAAGAGAYLATRHASETTAAAPASPEPAPTVGVTGEPVEATEAIVEAPAPEPAPEPARPAPRAAAPEPRREPEPEPVRRPARRQAPVAQSAPPPPPLPAPEPERVEAQPLPETYVDRQAALEPPPPPEPQFIDLVVPADAVVGLQIEDTVTSETARVEDRVDARVTRDVRVDGRVAIPAGSRVIGTVSLVERGGKVKERARLGVRFHTVILADGSEARLQSETIFREGDSPAGSSAAKIGGGAVGGAILGAILGGGKGAVIGGATGAAGGTAATMAGDRRPATLPAGSTVTVKVLSPVTVTVEKE